MSTLQVIREKCTKQATKLAGACFFGEAYSRGDWGVEIVYTPKTHKKQYTILKYKGKDILSQCNSSVTLTLAGFNEAKVYHVLKAFYWFKVERRNKKWLLDGREWNGDKVIYVKVEPGRRKPWSYV